MMNLSNEYIFYLFLAKYIKDKYFSDIEVKKNEFLIKVLEITDNEISLDLNENELLFYKESLLNLYEIFKNCHNQSVDKFIYEKVEEVVSNLDNYVDIDNYLLLIDKYSKNSAIKELLELKENDSILTITSNNCNELSDNIYLYNLSMLNLSNDSYEKAIIYISLEEKLLNDLSNSNIVKNNIYPLKQYDKIICKTNTKESTSNPFRSIEFAFKNLKDNGKIVVIIEDKYLSDFNYFLNRKSLIENKLIESVVKVDDEYFIVLTNACKTSVTFANLDNLLVTRPYSIKWQLKEIKVEIKKVICKEEDLYIRNISYDKLDKILNDDNLFYKYVSAKLDCIKSCGIEYNTKIIEKKLLSLNPKIYIDEYKNEFKTLDGLMNNLNESYSKLEKINKKRRL